MTALACPGCGNAMRSLQLERQTIGAVDIDLCGSCQAFWFDAFESVQLTAAGTIELFRAIHESAAVPRTPLPTRLPCPRCASPLRVTQDLSVHGRFVYFRCEFGHGRFTPFVQFLREKNFLRTVPPEELARLRSLVRVIRCASCGAPVDLTRDTACGYCHSPITILDPESVARTLRELDAAAATRSRLAAPQGAAESVALSSFAEALAAQQRQDRSGLAVDLVGVGLAALGAILFR